MRRAGIWLRAAALGIDLLLAGVLSLLFGLSVLYLVAESGHAALAQYLYELVGLGLLLTYTSFEVWAGRTPGKIIFGLRIAFPDGAPADRWTLLLRWSTKWSPFLLAFVSSATLQPTLIENLRGLMGSVIFVGCLQMLDEDKRTWHDQWSRTAVFRRLPIQRLAVG